MQVDALIATAYRCRHSLKSKGDEHDRVMCSRSGFGGPASRHACRAAKRATHRAERRASRAIERLR